MSYLGGVDPGLSGAIAVLDPDSARMCIIDMPIFEFETNKTRKRVDPYGIIEFLRTRPLANIYIEEVNSSPQQGVVSAFSFGMGRGLLLGLMAGLGIPLTEVKPTQWKKDLRVPADKKAAVLRASQLLPAMAPQFRGPRGGTLDGRAEAALLALYGAMDLGRAPSTPVTAW